MLRTIANLHRVVAVAHVLLYRLIFDQLFAELIEVGNLQVRAGTYRS